MNANEREYGRRLLTFHDKPELGGRQGGRSVSDWKCGEDLFAVTVNTSSGPARSRNRRRAREAEQDGVDGQADGGPRGLALPPVEHELFLFQGFQEVFRNLLHLFFFLLSTPFHKYADVLCVARSAWWWHRG